jgi:hypothetical protein
LLSVCDWLPISCERDHGDDTGEQARYDGEVSCEGWLGAPLGSASGLGPKLVGVDPPTLDRDDEDAVGEATGLDAGDARAAASAECATTRTFIRWPASQRPGTPLTK